MREIKFRVWEKKNKRWIHKNIALVDDGQPYWIFGYSAEVVLRDEFEIMQFTGLIDKNGSEIYEGDILSIKLNAETNLKVPVEFKRAGFYADEYPVFAVAHEAEVIGNVCEIPEILK